MSKKIVHLYTNFKGLTAKPGEEFLACPKEGRSSDMRYHIEVSATWIKEAKDGARVGYVLVKEPK